MTARGPGEHDYEALQREVLELRIRVAELQRAAARYEEVDHGALAEREELLRDAERVAHLGTWTWEPATGAVKWSDEMYRILGLPLGSITPSVDAFFAAVHPDDVAHAKEATEKSLREGVLSPLDCRLIRPDGSIRHTTATSSMLFDASGVPRRIVGSVLDRTDEVEMREKLAHSQKMEAVGRLAGGIAHDFSNLLTVVMGNLQLLESEIGKRPELEGSMQALASATTLTRRLLTFGQRAQLSLRRIELNDLVRSTAAMMHRLVGGQVQIELALAPSLPVVKIDPIEIERALMNLVVNARDAMPEGGVVRVSTAVRETPEGNWVELSVTDQGIGIAEADRARIFDPFFTTRGSVGGTGLGLATVLGTAVQHGGTVRVEAAPEQGSIFTIVLPVAPSSTSDRPESARAPEPPSKGTLPLQLLVIDDQPEVAKVTRALLEEYGHSVRIARSAKEALAIWAEHGKTIDLVLCDVAMADMRGPLLVERMARDGVAPRVLFVTGYSDEATRSELKHPVLAKPFAVDALLHAVESLTREG